MEKKEAEEKDGELVLSFDDEHLKLDNEQDG